MTVPRQSHPLHPSQPLCSQVVLAGELGLCYASLAMATDYDCWRCDGEAVDVARVLACMR